MKKRTEKEKPIEKAKRWWADHAGADQYVVSPAKAPSPQIAQLLKRENLVMEVAGRRAWILVERRPPDRRAVFLANYWPVVALVLERYAPAAVTGLSAVRLRLEEFSPPEELTVEHAASQSEYPIELEPGFDLRLRPREVTPDRIDWVTATGSTRIPVLSPAALLLTLDEPEITRGIEQVSAWIRHLVIRTPDLEDALKANPRPTVLQRVADLAKELGNTSLASQLDAAASRLSAHVVSPGRTGVGTRIVVPQIVLDSTRDRSTPWLDEQRMRLARQELEIRQVIGTTELSRFPLQRLVANAFESKAYDAYHSTTMEGYRISRDVVDAIVEGKPLPNGPKDQTELEASLAVQGYAIAFDHVLELAKQRAPLNGTLMLDLHEDLFRPSVDAGIVSTGDLRSWRNGAVQLRGYRHVPPNPKKIRDLIDGLEQFAARKELDGLTKALLVHLEFVTIHPFGDGNGRLGRFLLNSSLLQEGLPWVTVRSDERIPFFRSIERAQVNGNSESYIAFMWHAIQQAVADLEARGNKSTNKTA
ncbi:MAG: Fic family protein [Betaproteobacteria bacterium]